MTFLDSILNKSKKHYSPFDHWEYNDPLTENAIKEVINADIPDISKQNLLYDGTRAIDGGTPEFRGGDASGGKAIFRKEWHERNDNISISVTLSNISIEKIP